jgi:tetraacyldisaccharide 4'-kinase
VFSRSDLDVNRDEIVIMTEKDAIKCRDMADERHWFLKVRAELDSRLLDRILTLLSERKKEDD